MKVGAALYVLQDQLIVSFPPRCPGSVRCLTYDRERRILYSGGFDQVIILWDIGSQKGTAYELTGHQYVVHDYNYLQCTCHEGLVVSPSTANLVEDIPLPAQANLDPARHAWLG